MNSTTSTRKTTRPVQRRACATSLPQLAPISSWEIACCASTPVVLTIASTTLALSGVGERLGLHEDRRSLPEVVTTALRRRSMPVPATAVAELVGVVLGDLARGQRDACTARRP